MNKKAVGAAIAVVLLAGSALGAPALIGLRVTKGLDAYTGELVQVLPSFRVTEKRVHHGVFHSTRTVTVELGCLPSVMPFPMPGTAEPEPEPIAITLVDEIRHGPFLGAGGLGAAVIESQLVVPEAWRPVVKRLFGDRPPLRAHTTVRFDGSLQSVVTLAQLNVGDGEPAVALKPVVLTFETTPATASAGAKYRVAAAPIELKGSDSAMTATMQVVGFESETTMLDASPKAAPGSWLRPSKSTARVKSLGMRSRVIDAHGAPAGAFDVGLDDLSAASETTIEKGLLSSESRLSMKGHFNDLHFDKIDAAVALRRVYAAAYQNVLSRQLGSLFSCDQDAQLQAMAQLQSDQQKLLTDVLVQDPEYALDHLRIELGGQHAQLSYSIGTRGITRADMARPLPLLIDKVVARVDAEIQLGLIERMVKGLSEDIAAVAKSAAGPSSAGTPLPLPPLPAGLRAGDPAASSAMLNVMLAQLAGQNYIVRTGDLIKFTAEFAHGHAAINGKPIALPDLSALPVPGALPIAGP